MKIEQLSFDKVHVLLSGEDLKKMDISPEKFLTDSGSMHTFILNILHEIYETTDFNPFSGSITMEAMPDGDGMSIILTKGTIPKQAPAATPREAVQRIAEILGIDDGKHRKQPKIRSVKAVKTEDIRGHRAFMFADFDDLCMALARIDEVTAQSSSLYRIDGEYALLVPVLTRTLDDIAMIMEFSSKVRRELAHMHIREHGELVAEDKELVSMIKGIKNLHKI